MKNYIVTLALIFLLTACSFTDIPDPQSQITSPSVFQEKSSANAALSDIYARIREEGVICGTTSAGTVLMANYADELTFYGTNVSTEQFAKHTLLPTNTYLNTMWRATYSHIYAVNAFLEGMAASDRINGETRDRFIGEGLFLRAYLHFYLVNGYGEIPYVTTTDFGVNSSIGKSTVDKVYTDIMADLLQAQSLIPDTYATQERVRPNKAAVTALLSRVSLYRQDWQKAAGYATAVLEDAQYTWQEDITQEFLKDNPSVIWALHPGKAGLNTRDARSYIFTSGPPIRSALSPDFVNEFEAGDLRRTSWIKAVNGSSGPWYHAFKYKKTTTTGTSTEYTILFRLAELYLIRAEALAMMEDHNGAKADVNKIRSRAGLPDSEAETQGDILAEIEKQRRFELFTEQSHRWFDLKRTGRADAVLSLVKPNWKPEHNLLPLPENELLLNPHLLPQNPGY